MLICENCHLKELSSSKGHTRNVFATASITTARSANVHKYIDSPPTVISDERAAVDVSLDGICGLRIF